MRRKLNSSFSQLSIKLIKRIIYYLAYLFPRERLNYISFDINKKFIRNINQSVKALYIVVFVRFSLIIF